jgi:translation elongation factor EF-1alpha
MVIQMKKNIIFYGPANHGKSTMMGYLSATIKKTDMNKMERYFMSELGDGYKGKFLFTYLINKYLWLTQRIFNNLIGDYIDKKVVTKTANSINNAFRTIPLDINSGITEFTFIDTPGQIDKSHIRDEALHLGEIGIFCIEMGEIVNTDFNYEYLEQYEHWSIITGMKPIILLTKTDLNLSEEDYLNASKIIKNFRDFGDDVKIIPVAIIVSERRSFNVMDVATETPWYTGPTLIEAIKQVAVI